MANRTVLLLVLLFNIFLLPLHPSDFYVDDSQGEPVFFATGEWVSVKNSFSRGGSYLYTRRNSPLSKATWVPDLPESGLYEVAVIYPSGITCTNDAVFKVMHADGESIVHINMSFKRNGLFEISFGRFSFIKGSQTRIELLNVGGEGVYIADTLRWKKVVDQAPKIHWIRYSPYNPKSKDQIFLSALVTDDAGIKSAEGFWKPVKSQAWSPLEVNDKGKGIDLVADDHVYSGSIPGTEQDMYVYFSAFDEKGNKSKSEELRIVLNRKSEYSLVLNEIQTDNLNTLEDRDFGKTSAWVEILNNGPDTADLGLYSLSVKHGTDTFYHFPYGSFLGPQQSVIVWLDGKNTFKREYHTGFKWKQKDNALFLYYRQDNNVVDSISVSAKLPVDGSLSRIPDGKGDCEITDFSSPYKPNIPGRKGKKPVFSSSSGMYSGPVKLEIKAPGSSEIRYTLDGSDPDKTSNRYGKPVILDRTSQVKARAFYTKALPSDITCSGYFIKTPSGRIIPSMNIIIPENDLYDPATGIYYNPKNRGDAWEKKIFAVYYDPGNKKTEEFHAGLRIHGGASRYAAKKSFRLYFRKKYRSKDISFSRLKTAADGKIDQVVLRAGANDSYMVNVDTQFVEATYVRDQLIRDWFNDMGHRSAEGFFLALYINGKYWGLYNLTERINSDYMKRYFKGKNWDVVKGTWNYTQKFFSEAVDGDIFAYDEFINWIDERDFKDNNNFRELQKKLDYTNFLDYFILNIFCEAVDWPHNNWIIAKSEELDSLWTFHPWDSERSLGLRPNGYDHDTLSWAIKPFFFERDNNGGTAPNSRIFNAILRNENGKNDFISRIDDALNFPLNTGKTLKDFEEYIREIQPEIRHEIARWHPYVLKGFRDQGKLLTLWQKAIGNMRIFLDKRPDFFRSLIVSHFNLKGYRKININKTGQGNGAVSINGHVVPLPWQGKFFIGSRLRLSVRPGGKSDRFLVWGGDFVSRDMDAVYIVNNKENQTITVTFGTY